MNSQCCCYKCSFSVITAHNARTHTKCKRRVRWSFIYMCAVCICICVCVCELVAAATSAIRHVHNARDDNIFAFEAAAWPMIRINTYMYERLCWCCFSHVPGCSETNKPNVVDCAHVCVFPSNIHCSICLFYMCMCVRVYMIFFYISIHFRRNWNYSPMNNKFMYVTDSTGPTVYSKMRQQQRQRYVKEKRNQKKRDKKNLLLINI